MQRGVELRISQVSDTVLALNFGASEFQCPPNAVELCGFRTFKRYINRTDQQPEDLESRHRFGILRVHGIGV